MSPSATAEDSDATVSALRKVLTSESVPLARRFRALFSLKHVASQKPPTTQTIPAIHAIAAGFESPSALLKHELAYCLGQSNNLSAVPFLRRVLEDKSEDSMCRHEAAEALGALGDVQSLDILRALRDAKDEPDVVRETCDLAVARIEWESSEQRNLERLKQRHVPVWPGTLKVLKSFSSDFSSIDPAPPLPQATQILSIPDLETMLLDTRLPLFQRYRAMFALRDLASPPDLPTAVPAVHSLARGFTDSSALFRHEIAFVFGQLSHPASIPSLMAVLKDTTEASMVRHEAAEALGSLGEEADVEDVLRQYLADPEQVVRESVVVALDMARFEKEGEAEYALMPGEFIEPVAVI